MELGYINKFVVSLVKVEKKIKQTYSDSELEILLKKPDINKCHFGEYRNWTIVNFLLTTACRASTVVNIKIEDIDMVKEYVNMFTEDL